MKSRISQYIPYVYCILVFQALFFVHCLADASQDYNHKSGFFRLFEDLVKLCKCTLAKSRSNMDPVEEAASYTRHRTVGLCRIYVGPYIEVYDAAACRDHSHPRVKELLEMCRSAITYHTPEGKIAWVDAEPIIGLREYIPGGPYKIRIQEKPSVEHAEFRFDLPFNTPILHLFDSEKRLLLKFPCNAPLVQVTTENEFNDLEGKSDDSGRLDQQEHKNVILYEINPALLSHAQRFVNMHNIKTAEAR